MWSPSDAGSRSSARGLSTCGTQGNHTPRQIEGPPLVTLCPAKNTRQSPTASAVGPRVARGHSPDRGDRNSHGDFCGFVTTAARSRHSWESAVPDGTCRFVGIAFPPLKRWATVGCPCQDNDGCFLWKNRPVQPSPGEVEELLEAEGVLRRMAIPLLRKSDGMFSPAARLKA